MALQIVVPMAGAGQRFKDAGYTTPKPLISIAGVPMVVRAINELPDAGRVIFLVLESHIREHQIDQVLSSLIPTCSIVVVDGVTAGQACTVRLAQAELNEEWPVIVAACDNSHLYDSSQLELMMQDASVECLVWTYRGEPRTAIRPRQYGWVQVDGCRVRRVSCKSPISQTPVDDHVVSGFFFFRSAGRMMHYIDKMVAADMRVNGEFYMDIVPNVMVADGHDVRVFEVEKYIGWGTPEELAEFQKWERYCARLR